VEPDPRDVEAVCHLITTGRETGEPHEIEIWFAALADSLYLISGGGLDADWVLNLLADPNAEVRVGEETIPVVGRVPVHPGEERTVAVDHLYDKYGEQVTGTRDEWHRTVLVVALDIHPHTK
jgi:deazaflavin-dependent oxidoreductase (nitroreductase family)